ncbi:MAG: BrnT family toxin [Desulfobacterales bacterium]|nr:BrnT family toxin [Desulfobacterales bacterium]
MKYFDWNVEKNAELWTERGIAFEDVVFFINHGGLLDTIEHPNKERYPNQRIFIVNIDDYAYLVPFVEDEKAIFLKTIIPSRKMTKKYLGGQSK